MVSPHLCGINQVIAWLAHAVKLVFREFADQIALHLECDCKFCVCLCTSLYILFYEILFIWERWRILLLIHALGIIKILFMKCFTSILFAALAASAKYAFNRHPRLFNESVFYLFRSSITAHMLSAEPALKYVKRKKVNTYHKEAIKATYKLFKVKTHLL